MDGIDKVLIAGPRTATAANFVAVLVAEAASPRRRTTRHGLDRPQRGLGGAARGLPMINSSWWAWSRVEQRHCREAP
jgi:hypothetical protein